MYRKFHVERFQRDEPLAYMHSKASLQLIDNEDQLYKYQYDLVVVGGGSAGMAVSKEAASFGARVACIDFVKPSPHGTSWALGGTCVNVGCIPKKLMHQAAILKHCLEDAPKYGWKMGDEEYKHDWKKLKQNARDYIGSLNNNCRLNLREKKVKYLNAFGEFINKHTLKATDKKGKETILQSHKFVLCMGCRPKYPTDIQGIEHCISSDDIFYMKTPPGRTLIIGASYIALETAGFLVQIQFDVTVLVRSIVLRGFDLQMADMVESYMANHGTRFIQPAKPTLIEMLEEATEDEPGLYRVTMEKRDGTVLVEEFNTVMVAVGREPCTKNIGLEKLGVELTKDGYVEHNDMEQTTCKNIFAIGDILKDKPELTPTAIHAGKLLARRLYGNSNRKMDYYFVPTTVYTPLEYGCVGMSEEAAIERYGSDDIEIYHSHFQPLEWVIPEREPNACYAKLVCVKSQKERVVGFHVVGPNAAEITQGFTLSLKLGATKSDFDNAVGIHPTCAEVFMQMVTTKSSGKDATVGKC